MWSSLDAKWFGFFGAAVGAGATLVAAIIVSGADQAKIVRLEHEVAVRTGERDSAHADRDKAQARLAEVEENATAKLGADNMTISLAQIPNTLSDDKCVKRLATTAEQEGVSVVAASTSSLNLIANGDLLSVWCLDTENSVHIGASSLKGSARDTINLALGAFDEAQ